MPASSTLGVFLLAALTLLVIPGPAVLYIVGRSLHQGRRAGLASMVGIEAGTMVHITAAAFGLSALLMASALAFSVVKYAGAAYLVYLGIRTLLSKSGAQEVGPVRRDSLRRIFGQGVLVSLFNPKSSLFFFAFLPQFVDPARGSVPQQVLLLGGLFILLSVFTDGAYAMLAGTMGQQLQNRPRLWRRQRFVSGGIYLTLGITAAFAGEPHH